MVRKPKEPLKETPIPEEGSESGSVGTSEGTLDESYVKDEAGRPQNWLTRSLF